jgi:flagellar basal body-associated protein FliL
MAEQTQDNPRPEPKSEGAAQGANRLGMLISVAMILGVVLVSSAAGWAAARLVSASDQPTQAAEQPSDGQQQADESPASPDAPQKHHDLETITVNLNEARLTRYVSADVTLAFDEKNAKEVEAGLAAHAPELKDWLTGYLAGLTIDQVRGQDGQNRIKREIRDGVNEILWPDQRPRVTRVLLSKFQIQ